MAKVEKLVITCDRHGGVIEDDAEFLHLVATPGRTKPGRKTREGFDLCQGCAKDFLKFMEGPAQKKGRSRG